jgi:hypothetical protein
MEEILNNIKQTRCEVSKLQRKIIIKRAHKPIGIARRKNRLGWSKRDGDKIQHVKKNHNRNNNSSISNGQEREAGTMKRTHKLKCKLQ